MEFKPGDSVRVKRGVKDPDYGFDLAGWQGRVINVDIDKYEGLFTEIAWDSITLNRMPAEFIETGLEEGFGYSSMWLSRKEVVPAEPRDRQQDVDGAIQALNEQHGYVGPEEHEKNIAWILDSGDLSVTGENLERYYSYLAGHIEYPCLLTGAEDFPWEEPYVLGVFDQKEYVELKKERASYTDRFELVRLEDRIDDLRGILVRVKRIADRKRFILPLWDLKTADRKDRNHRLIDDYSCWMTNYR